MICLKKYSVLILISLFLLSACSSENKKAEEITDPSNNYRGTKFTKIHNFEITKSANFIVADTIQYFTGEKAEAEYLKDFRKEIEEKTFYLRNTAKDTIKFMLAEDVKIKANFFDHGKDKSVNDVLAGINKLFADDKNNFFSQLPFKLKFVNGKVTEVEEIYIP